MKKLVAVAALIAAATAGCATTGANGNAQMAEFSNTIPVCAGEAECQLAWEAAQLWIAQNSRFKIQTATNVLIETYNGGPYDATLSPRATKEPLGGGKYQIVFGGGCNNLFGCVPSKWEAGIQFNQYVTTAMQNP